MAHRMGLASLHFAKWVVVRWGFRNTSCCVSTVSARMVEFNTLHVISEGRRFAHFLHPHPITHYLTSAGALGGGGVARRRWRGPRGAKAPAAAGEAAEALPVEARRGPAGGKGEALSDGNKRYRNKRGRKFRANSRKCCKNNFANLQICTNFAQIRPILHVSAFF